MPARSRRLVGQSNNPDGRPSQVYPVFQGTPRRRKSSQSVSVREGIEARWVNGGTGRDSAAVGRPLPFGMPYVAEGLN